jgi:hypothetical protein
MKNSNTSPQKRGSDSHSKKHVVGPLVNCETPDCPALVRPGRRHCSSCREGRPPIPPKAAPRRFVVAPLLALRLRREQEGQR